MKVKFNENFFTKVPTECLIEDYQSLAFALRLLNGSDPCGLDEAKDEIACVMECLAEAIHRYTPDTPFKPSPSSVIAMGVSNGILCNDDGSDIRCAAGNPISEAMCGGACQCSETCMKQHSCDPERVLLQLECGHLYEGTSRTEDNLMDALEEFNAPA